MRLIMQMWGYDWKNASPVYAIVSVQGEILGWSVNRRAAARQLDCFGEARGVLKLVKMVLQ